MKEIWRLMAVYLLVIFFIIISSMAYGQNICKKDVCVVEFNASWNETNGVDYLE